ncbi:MAG: 2-oxoacid:acceptor oxidoreductase family protein, partial [Candidatus Helarchaeota archaeon]|nr:2-oxoacid:acceptor oxidoreductase family protein [Candidatus Helarchaeota archaeon]
GKYSQGFPEYGPERMGAPVRGFTRISDAQIKVHCSISNPDIVVILDSTLLDLVDVADGLTDDGIVIVNSSLPPAEIRKKLKMKNGKVFTVNASQIALDELGRDIPNMPMLGAMLKITNMLKLETLTSGIQTKFLKKFNEKIVEGNAKAVKRAYEEVIGE